MFVTFSPRARRTVTLVLALAGAGVPLAASAASGATTDAPSFSWRSVTSWVTPYKADLVQGNFVSLEQVQALKPGMTRQQVRDILGTPLLTSVFHAQRWDYVFILERQGLERQQFKTTVFFNSADVFDHIEGDTMPTEVEFAARIDLPRSHGKLPVLEATEAELAAFPAPAPAPAAAPAQGEPPASYPPLEPLAR